MAEEEKPGGAGQASGTTGQGEGGDGGQEPGPVPYDRFQKVNARAKSLQEELDKLKQERAQAADQKLADEKRWEELATQYKTELEQERQTRLRLEIGSKFGLDGELANRLQGKDEAELAADAEKLAALVKTKPAGTPPPGNGQPPQGPTPEQLRDPKWVRENLTAVFEAGKPKS